MHTEVHRSEREVNTLTSPSFDGDDKDISRKVIRPLSDAIKCDWWQHRGHRIPNIAAGTVN